MLSARWASIPGNPSEAVRRKEEETDAEDKRLRAQQQKIFLLLALFTFFPLHVNIMLSPFTLIFPSKGAPKP